MFNFMKKSSSAASGVSSSNTSALSTTTTSSSSALFGNGVGSVSTNSFFSPNTTDSMILPVSLTDNNSTNGTIGSRAGSLTKDTGGGGGGGGSTRDNNSSKDKRKRNSTKDNSKKDRKEKQKRERVRMSAEELLRLDEVRRSLKIRGRRHKDKEKLPSGITADYMADFLANLQNPTPPPPLPPPPPPPPSKNDQKSTQPNTKNNNNSINLISNNQSDSAEANMNLIGYHQYYLNRFRIREAVPPLPPRPPKRGILKQSKVSTISTYSSFSDSVGGGGGDPSNSTTTPSECGGGGVVITYQNIGETTQNSRVMVTSPSADSLSDTTPPFSTPPCSTSPVGESQGHLRWSKYSIDGTTSTVLDPYGSRYTLPLPNLVPITLPPPRLLKIYRQRPPRHDFGFSLRRAMILQRPPHKISNGTTTDTDPDSIDDGIDTSSAGNVMKAVIFAEPGTSTVHHQFNDNTGLLPGDKLLEVNGTSALQKSREEIIEMIKASGDYVSLKVQPVAELCELSRRSAGFDGGEDVILADSNIQCGTLKRSGITRFNKSLKAKSEDFLELEKQWLKTQKVWLMHRGGFTAAIKLQNDPVGGGSSNNGETTTPPPPPIGHCHIRIEANGNVLTVDEEYVEMANPSQFDHVEDVVNLRYLNESSVLHTLRQRYATNLIHTYAGHDNLLVINPMAPLAIYSEKVVSLFKGCQIEDMPPHIYSMAQAAYHTMLTTRRDQSIVFLGRAGAGKTSNFRHTCQYLLTASITPAKTLTVEKLTALWTILENFGNCRTTLNSNATRFTQIFTIDFDQSGGGIVSANLQVLLLENWRILRRSKTKDVDEDDGNEGTFHIVERCLKATPDLLHTNDIMCTQDNDVVKVMNSFNVLGVHSSEQRVIFTVLAAILHLLNGTHQRAAQFLGTTWDVLTHVIYGDGPQQQQHLLDGFIIGLYTELVNAVVYLINRSLIVAPSITTTTNTASIFLVDVPGFQNPATMAPTTTDFHDFCHNYLHERLHLLAYQCNITAPLHRYQQETIDVNVTVDSSDDRSMVQLLDRKPSSSSSQHNHHHLDQEMGAGDVKGIFWLLDEGQLQSDQQLFERMRDLERHHQRHHRRTTPPPIRKVNNLQFCLEHLHATNPVIYTVEGWLQKCREQTTVREALSVLQESSKDDLRQLFISARGGLTGISSSFSSSLLGIDSCHYATSSSTTLKKATSSAVRRTLTNSGATIPTVGGMKRKSVCLQIKFIVDGLIEMLRRTKIRFVHCFLPQHNAGRCDIMKTSGSAPLNVDLDGSNLINIPLLRSQLRGHQILDMARVYKQGYPNSMPLGEFSRRFKLLLTTPSTSGSEQDTTSTTSAKDIVVTSSGKSEERKTVEEILLAVDLETSSYRVGITQVFFRNGVLPQLEAQRDERISGVVVSLQAQCRGYLARKRHVQRKLQDLAVRCVQKNVRKFVLVRNWSWWRLFQRVTPLLNVHRTEEELKQKTDELELMKLKCEKLEKERTLLRQENDKLEAKLSGLASDLAEEHSTATVTAERLETETGERLKLERELFGLAERNQQLQQHNDRLEMELVYARSDCTGSTSANSVDEGEDYENNNSSDLLLDQSNNTSSNSTNTVVPNVYRQRYKRTLKELEFVKKRLHQQHEDDLEQLVGLKKQLEKKLNDAYEEVEEQRQVVTQWKRKVTKLTSEMNDLRLLLDEQNGRNNLLEKKQRRFDSETSQLHDELKKERQQKDRIQREKDVLIAEKYTIESALTDVRLDLEIKDDKLVTLQQEFDEVTAGGRSDEECTALRRQKIECERRIQEQDEELDEMAGQVQILEQAKIRLEMALESMRKDAKKDAQQRDDELDEVRGSTQKKLKLLEQQLEHEHEERTILLRDKHDLERRLTTLTDVERTERANTEQLVQRLKRDLKRTKILLRDTQIQLEHHQQQHTDDGTKSMGLVRQLRHQLDDLECARATLQRTKSSLEAELVDCQTQLDESTRMRNETDTKLLQMQRMRTELQSQLDENEEELAELLKKYKQCVQQMSRDQSALQEHIQMVGEVETERNQLRDQVTELSMRIECLESAGSVTSQSLVKCGEVKVKELERKLELELATRSRCEVQMVRLKDAIERLEGELGTVHQREQEGQEECRRLQRCIRDLKEEVGKCANRTNAEVQRRKDAEKRCEMGEGDAAGLRTELKVALKRIDDLQMALQTELLDNSLSDNTDDSEQDGGSGGGVGGGSASSDDSLGLPVMQHVLKTAPSNGYNNNTSTSSRSSGIGRDSLSGNGGGGYA